MPEALVDQREAARYLGVSERTIEAWRVAGCGPAYVALGRRRLYRRTDLDAFVASRVRQTTDSLAQAA